MSLKRQFVWSLAPLLVISAVNIFSVPLFYRYLGAEKYGLWFYVITLNGMFGFADLGLGVAVGRYIGVALGRGDHGAVREYWGTGNLIALPLLGVMSLLFGLLGALFGPQWFNVSPENEQLLRVCFIPAAFALFFNYYAQIWSILLQAHLDFKFSSILRIGAAVLQVVPSIVLAWRTHDPWLILIWSAVIGAAQVAWFVWYSRREYHLGLSLKHASVARAREMAAYTGKTFVSLVLGSVLYSIDRVVLGRLAPPQGFTDYSIAANVGSRLQGFGISAMGPVFHNTSRASAGGDSRSTARIYDETFSLVFDWYLLAVIWALLWHPALLRVWLGPSHATQVAPLFVPLIIAFCLNGIANISGAQLGAMNRVGANLAFTVIAGLLAMAGVYAGWKTAGLTGAAYGFLASRVAFLAQDLYAARLVGGAGWVSSATWFPVLLQTSIGGVFALSYLLFPRNSPWLLIPAALHASLMGTWLLRHPLKKLFGGVFATRDIPPAASAPPAD